MAAGGGRHQPLENRRQHRRRRRDQAVGRRRERRLGSRPCRQPSRRRRDHPGDTAQRPDLGSDRQARQRHPGQSKQLESQDHVAVYVTGQTAVNIDTSAKLASALPIFVILIVGLALLLLIVVFRSLLVPLTAAVGFILSVLAALGLTRLVFQSGHGQTLFGVTSPGPVVSFVPVLAVAIMFGLAMDYEVFLVSRMREAHTEARRLGRQPSAASPPAPESSRLPPSS